MADNLAKLETLRSRCTGYAEEFLHELKANPRLPDVLDRLVALDGLITRADIERVLLDLRKPGGK